MHNVYYTNNNYTEIYKVGFIWHDNDEVGLPGTIMK